MLVSLYVGNGFLKVFALVAYALRIIIVIIWGTILMYRYDYNFGYKLGFDSDKNRDD